MLAVTAELQNSGATELEFARYSNGLWPDFARRLEAESGRNIGYAADGALILAEDAAALVRLERQADQPGLELIDAGRVRKIAPLVTADIAGGLWSPHEAHVDNRALGPALAIAFQKAGGRLLTNEGVVRIERRGGPRRSRPYTFRTLSRRRFPSGCRRLERAAGTGDRPDHGGERPDDPDDAASRADRARSRHLGQRNLCRTAGGGLAIGATVEEAGFDTSLTDDARETLRPRRKN